DHLVDISRLGELQGIERRNGHVWIGGGTTEAAVEASALVATEAPLLARATPLIGHRQIRNRGTIGGSLAHADPAAEYPAVAVALDATFDVVSSTGSRTVPAADFFDGVWSTSLEDGELLRSISFPVWAGRCGFGVAEFARRHGDFAIAGAVAAVELGPDDAVVRSALSIFGVAGTPTRATSTETGVAGRPSAEIDPDEVGRSAMDAIEDVSDDPQVPSDYRRRIGAAMVADAWRRAVDDAHHDGSPR
ncbi:MAG: FAD binding domain-containing protein, partial [Ilumatobacteraceae bacterium]